jgi:hypothetical protein
MQRLRATTHTINNCEKRLLEVALLPFCGKPFDGTIRYASDH